MTEMLEQQKKLELQNQELNQRFQQLAATLSADKKPTQRGSGQSESSFSVISEPAGTVGVTSLQRANLQNSSQPYLDDQHRTKRPITTG